MSQGIPLPAGAEVDGAIAADPGVDDRPGVSSCGERLAHQPDVAVTEVAVGILAATRVGDAVSDEHDGAGHASSLGMPRPHNGVMTDHIIVLPGGGYTDLSDDEAEPVADWLTGLGLSSSVFRYPVQTRHPGPLDAVRAEVARVRADGHERVGLLGFSAGGHAAGHATLAPPSADPD